MKKKYALTEKMGFQKFQRRLMENKILLIIVNTDGATYRFRKPIIKEALKQGYTVYTISSKSIYFPLLKDLGANPIEVDFNRDSISIFNNLHTCYKIIKIMKKVNPDIIHCFTHKASIFGTISGIICGIKYRFITITGLGKTFSRNTLKFKILQKILLMAYKAIFPHISKVFFQNHDDYQFFIEKKIVDGSKAIKTNGSGIDIEEFKPKEPSEISRLKSFYSKKLKSPLKDDEYIILFSGRGIVEKGIIEFFAAAEEIKNLFPNQYRFLFAGDLGKIQDSILQLIINYISKGIVESIGFIENMSDLKSIISVEVLPSYYREGTPRSLIESLALDKAIITTNMPGCRETVINSWNGFYCDLKHPQSIVDKIILITQSNFLIEAKGRSRKLAESKYDSKNLSNLTLSLYNSCLKSQ